MNGAEYSGNSYNACLTGDTLVTTADGVRQLKSLVGTTGVVFSEGGRFRPYHSVVSKGIKPVKEIVLRNGSKVKATGDHRFMTPNGWKRVDELVIGEDEIIVSSTPNVFTHTPYDETYEMYGWLNGDGWYSQTVGISFNSKDGDYDIKDRLLPVFKREFEMGDIAPLKDDEVSYQLQTSKASAMSKCESLGFKNGRACEKELPSTFYTWTLNQQISFIRGLLTADGFVYGNTKRQIAFATNSEKFVEQIHEFLSGLGIFARIYCTEFRTEDRKPQYKLTICNQSAFDYFEIFGFSGETKTNKFDSVNPSSPIRISPISEVVVSVTDAGEEEVFDINEVDKTNSFYANGMLAHNCNLASINLYEFVKDPFTPHASFDFEGFEKAVFMAVKSMDEVLDYGYDMQPLQANKDCLKDWRAIGLGIMGMADMFVAMSLAYGEDRSIKLMNEIMSLMRQSAVYASSERACERGSFLKYDYQKVAQAPMFKDLPRYVQEQVGKYGLRNGSLLSIAPTGSIATMLGVSSGIEPLFDVCYERTTHSLEGEGVTFKVLPKSVEALLKYHGIDPQSMTKEQIQAKFPFVVTAHDIPWQSRINMQAVIQAYVDNSISSTINLPQSATPQDIFDAYMYAWRQGCKGITVFRAGCKRDAILGGNTKKEALVDAPETAPQARRREFKRLQGETFTEHSACAENMYVTVNKKNGKVFEVLTAASGGCQANINTITRLASRLLRNGENPQKVMEDLQSNLCPACTTLRRQGADVSVSCGGCIADALKASIETSVPVGASYLQDPGLLACPDCGQHTLRPEGKCFTCSNCGFSRCD